MKQKFILMTLVLLTTIVAACASNSPTASSTTNNNPTSGQTTTDTTNIIKLNLNTVSGDELLAAIPGFSNRMVREFQEYRPYISIQQFRREIGKYVSDEQVADYEKYVYVPIAINDSDAETLLQIPGLDATEVETLMSSRPYASTDEFLAKLSEFISVAELEIAKTYLGNQ